MSIGSTAVASGTADADAVVAAKYNLRLRGFSIAETAGTAATAEAPLMHGATGASGSKVTAPINLAADGFGIWMFSEGIPCPNGISIDRVSGTTEFVIYWEYS